MRVEILGETNELLREKGKFISRQYETMIRCVHKTGKTALGNNLPNKLRLDRTPHARWLSHSVQLPASRHFAVDLVYLSRIIWIAQALRYKR